MQNKETHSRSMTKSIIWRIFGIMFLALVTLLVTGNWVVTIGVTISHHLIFLAVYYFHERFWLRIKWLKNSKWRYIARMILYEIVLGNLILSSIVWVFTGDIKQITMVTGIYIFNKLWMYVIYDKIWEKIKWGRKPVVVYTYVVCDLLHKGHLECLKQAKALGDYLIVGVLTDEATMAYKRKPVIPFDERIDMVSALRCVDEVVGQESLDPTENLKRYKPDILTHGHDANVEFPGGPEAFAATACIKLVRTQYYPGQSTTKIIKKVRSDEYAHSDR